MNQNDPNDTMKGLQFVSKVSMWSIWYTIWSVWHTNFETVNWAILVWDVKNPSSWWWTFSKQVGKDLVALTYANDVRDRIDLVSLKELRLSYQKKWALSSTIQNFGTVQVVKPWESYPSETWIEIKYQEKILVEWNLKIEFTSCICLSWLGCKSLQITT
jgi:hypothetical protein